MSEPKAIYNAGDPEPPMSNLEKIFLIDGIRQSLTNAYHALERGDRVLFRACLDQSQYDLSYLLEQEGCHASHDISA